MTQRLAELSDLATLPGLPVAALAGVGNPEKEAALDAASEYALGKIGGRYKRPLVSWETDMKHAVCKIAVYDLMVARGFNPASGADVNMRLRRDDADAWLTAVARQEISPAIEGAAEQSPAYDAPRVISRALQGWDRGRVRG